MEDSKKHHILFEKPESIEVLDRIWEERQKQDRHPRTVITAAELAAIKEQEEEDSYERIPNNGSGSSEKRDQ